MKIKTFYSKTMAEAFREIKTHLGADAILLSTKEIPQRSGVWGHSSGFEVVAACDDTGTVDVFSEDDGYGDRALKTGHPETGSGDFSHDIVQNGTYSPAKLAGKSPVACRGHHSFEKNRFIRARPIRMKRKMTKDRISKARSPNDSTTIWSTAAWMPPWQDSFYPWHGMSLNRGSGEAVMH